MSELTRRAWNKSALAGLAAAVFPLGGSGDTKKKIDSKFKGVQIGVQSYSLRDRPLDDALKAMTEIGIGSCELWQGHVEPTDLTRKVNDKTASEDARREAREAMRRWRTSVPLDHFKQVRVKFDRAGIELDAYNISFWDDYTDAEIERGFQMAKTLGARCITSSALLSNAERIDRFARKHRMRVGLHNHSRVENPNELSTPDTFARALRGASEYLAINLDIGHFTAANSDPVDYLRQHHARIVAVHLKDRKRDQGANVEWGKGDTPIKGVLALLRQNKWQIPANIEYEYKGADSAAEVKKCFEYCKQALGVA